MILQAIAHGDIKPHNVLIFKDGEATADGGSRGGYTAKVTDFGYSVMFRHPDSLIRMPKTPFWVAPEWRRRYSTDFAGAKKMDAYSFGLLCLWLLLYAGKCDIDKFYEELSVEEELSLEEDKSTIARRKVDEAIGIEEEVKERLRLFFENTLVKKDREGDFGVLLRILAQHR